MEYFVGGNIPLRQLRNEETLFKYVLKLEFWALAIALPRGKSSNIKIIVQINNILLSFSTYDKKVQYKIISMISYLHFFENYYLEQCAFFYQYITNETCKKTLLYTFSFYQHLPCKIKIWVK